MYALYKGENLLSMGSLQIIAKEMKVGIRTIQFYKTESYKKRLKKRKCSTNYRILIKI